MNNPTVLTHPRFLVVPKTGSTKLVIFFAGTGVEDHKFHFFGQSQQCGENVILVNNGQNHWYQDGVPGLGETLEETIATIKAWSVALGAPDIYCVGASMGGSGAALFGCLLGASVLAFGFEAKLDLPSSRSRKLSPPGYTFKIPDLSPLIAASKKPFHAYIGAEDAEDLIATSHLATYPNVNLTIMQNVTHGPPKYLRNRGRLRPLIEAFLDGNKMPVMPEAISVPRGFAEAFHLGHDGYWSRDYDRWEVACRVAVDIFPTSTAANFWLGRALLRAERFPDALKHLAVAKAARKREAHFYFAYGLRRMGLLDDAIALHEETVKKYPGYIDPLVDIAAAKASLGDLAGAIEATQKALTIEPQNASLAEKLSVYRKRFVRHAEPNVLAFLKA
ncbi:hypothetical protein OIU34_02295 [Pararhizobium sp. BT-229]|uniref:tetratricopeptide repeat protein n=1 Tax=Pararhizobium sp. BT-229 TaxID=2986923 RepID=UPI0021F6D6C5|nr:hypothetical protein [Pararhizobium sp. BT-229]MCV9960717.1 hypothetical protein [Pararhizobium sp. BT-229]